MPCPIPATSFSWYAKAIRNTFRTGAIWPRRRTIVLANPKTTGNGRYAFLGAYGYGLKVNNGDEGKTKDFVAALLKNTPVFENGGRAATTTFSQRHIGDVLVTFENEANYVSKKLTQDQFEIVYPSYTIFPSTGCRCGQRSRQKRHTRRC